MWGGIRAFKRQIRVAMFFFLYKYLTVVMVFEPVLAPGSSNDDINDASGFSAVRHENGVSIQMKMANKITED